VTWLENKVKDKHSVGRAKNQSHQLAICSSDSQDPNALGSLMKFGFIFHCCKKVHCKKMGCTFLKHFSKNNVR